MYDQITYSLVNDLQTKELMTDEILHSLPDWFGIEAAIRMYMKEVQDTEKPFHTAYDDKRHIGLISLKNNYSTTTDIFLMAVLKEYHRKGIGKELINWAKGYCLENKKKLLIVKTLSERHPDKNYTKTRLFYKGQGFFEFEENLEMWNGIPCLILAHVI
ncbi:MAG: GNAT family N-acetyltransferase [Bacteroidota bacterium]|nr:GNAT family N-acetyltransferase [Bacteroidota bacterium]